MNNRLIPLPDSPGLNNPISQQAPESFVDADALAEHLSVARRQVLEMTRRGIIPGHPLGVGRSRKAWRYKISEVEAAIASSVPRPDASQAGDRLAGSDARLTMPIGSSRSQRRKSNG